MRSDRGVLAAALLALSACSSGDPTDPATGGAGAQGKVRTFDKPGG
ncbi:hypothetical protein [Nocardioides sp.]|nr:hypothetical protein [Nocardioides sp.]MCW2738805.1 hypothetical protein [Nocardioides sp.]